MFRALSTAAAVAAFLLAVLGSWVRINGAGLTCPDWPLCHGQLIPALEGGVILEWSHRMVAFLEGFLLAGAGIAGWRARGRIAGVTPVLGFIAAAFALQVALGGATVFLANNPPSVAWHWATAMAFLAGLVALAILAWAAPARARRLEWGTPLVALLGTTALAAFAAMCAGAVVSSSGAGLACGTIPACEGGWTGTTAAQHVQMIHRGLAGIFALLATVAAYAACLAAPQRARIATLTGYALVVLQVLLGFANVAWSLPLALREAHAANAGLAFLAFVAAVVFAAIDGGVVPAASPRAVAARAGAVGS